MENKIIHFKINLLETTEPWEPIIHHIYTFDTDSVEIIFECEDIIEGFPIDTQADMYIYTNNKSFFKETPTIDNNKISFILPSEITRHWGTNKVQVVVSFDNKTYATPIRLFSINQGLETEVTNEVFIPEWNSFLNLTNSFYQATQAAESTRVLNEGVRVDKETIRQAKEEQRITNETARNDAEALRVLAEISRNDKEVIRNGAEAVRVSNETARVSAETTRATDETTRNNAEVLRISAETTRSNAETARITNETTRGSAETTRVNNETNRVEAETTRISNEEARQDYYDNFIVFELYSSTKDYKIGNKVTYQGSSYYALEDSKGEIPSSSEDWLLIAQKGQTGNIENLEAWHIAEALDYTPADAANMHNANVKNILNKFSEVSGKLYYDGNSISGISMGSIEPTDGSWWFEEIL